MRIPTGKVLKALASLSILWFALSLWYTATSRRHSHGDADEGAADINSDMERLLLPPRGSNWMSGQLVNNNNNNNNNSSSSRSFGDPFQTERQLRQWRASERHYCSHRLLAVPAGFARFPAGVLLDPSRGTGRRGGEDISEVLNQSENSEYWTFQSGAFRIACPEKPTGTRLSNFVASFANVKSHLNTRYLPGSSTLTEAEFEQLRRGSKVRHRIAGSVLAVTRYEYANLYHSMTDFYNAFLACVYYGIDPANATVLLVDGHPKGSLDAIWSTLFGRVLRIGQLAGLLTADDLVWVMMGYDSPLHNHVRPHLPLHAEFRRFFLSRHGVPLGGPSAGLSSSPSAGRNCTGALRLLFVWRRDYVAHPRNPKGRVVRKVANEEELEAEAREAFPGLKLRVSSASLENMPFSAQLRLVAGVQILAGMHGAALSHTLFLPHWSGLMELYPNYWGPGNIHFRSMARWRGLAYERWVNSDARNELPNFRTRVPRGVVTRLLRGLLRQMGCAGP